MTDERHARRLPPWGRLAAEFLVIVVGVLVALAAEAARQAGNDRAREAAYLRELQTDLDTTKEDLAGAIAIDEAALASADRALQAVGPSGPALLDSLSGWTIAATNSSASFQPTMGTVTALVESGELRLIRDEDVRRRLLRYHSSVGGALRILDGLNPHVWRTLEAMGSVLSLQELAEGGGRFPIDWEGLAADRAFHNALFHLRLSAQNRLFALRPLEASLDSLRGAL